MSDLSSQTQALDLRLVDDPGVRQALRSMYQQMLDKIAHQQLAIDAMLEMLIEKNFTSVGELGLGDRAIEADQAGHIQVFYALDIAAHHFEARLRVRCAAFVFNGSPA